ncbi:MAG: hypothetical protein MR374_01665 [Clostridia bacterium]|nr:hypothetical protein [Clostridia bacterium]
MSNERSCRLCKHIKTKNKFFGGKKFVCSLHNHDVGGVDVCSKFERDGEKVLQYAGFRHHECGSSDGCNTCAYYQSTHGKTETIYSCKKNNVQFWLGFSPMDYICDNFKDGGLDALLGYMADLLIEQDRYKKDGI